VVSRSELLYGIHAVRHALEVAPEAALELWLQRDARRAALSRVAALATGIGLRAQPVPRSTLDRLVDGAPHQGVVLRRRARPEMGEAELLRMLEDSRTAPLLLVLDGVEDPRNLGACLRVANAAGAQAVVAPLHRGTGITAVVRKVASGAADATPLVRVHNLARTLRSLAERGIRLLAAADDAERELYDLDLRGPLGVVLGAEGTGLRRLTRELCGSEMRLPMRGVVESLNVSVAAGICLYEALRQRRSGSGQIAGQEHLP
jgi:23S rRNA (guanosine2251-2'-O)-methyltransferase